MKPTQFETKASNILSAISNPFRIRILLTIGNGEACVCHLEALLKKRQAFISQHLMSLRQAGILATRRDGKYIFYRLADSGTYDLIRTAGKLAGVEDDQLPQVGNPTPSPKCFCPKCDQDNYQQKNTRASVDVQIIK